MPNEGYFCLYSLSLERVRVRVAQKLPLILTFSPEGRRNCYCAFASVLVAFAPRNVRQRCRFHPPLPSWIPAFEGMTKMVLGAGPDPRSLTPAFTFCLSPLTYIRFEDEDENEDDDELRGLTPDP